MQNVPQKPPVQEEPPVHDVVVPASGSEVFWQLIRDYQLEPGRREDILAEIDRRFRRPATILVIDTCGFTRSSRGVGIIHFLALLDRLDEIVVPEIERAGGGMFSREADNFFALMPDTSSAVECGRAILEKVRKANESLPPEQHFAVSIGVGHGDVFMIESGLIYGEEMNLAFKVGEDLAGPDELLLTPGARQALGDYPEDFEERRLTTSGLDVTAYRPLM